MSDNTALVWLIGIAGICGAMSDHIAFRLDHSRGPGRSRQVPSDWMDRPDTGTMTRRILAAFLALWWCAPALAQPAPADICTPGYAREHRMPADQAHAIKREMMRREHPGEPLSAYILDHRTPLCLGAGNDRANLQLQRPSEAHAKDRLEVHACRAVCAGSVSIDEARGWFADWKASYRRAFGGEP